LFVRHHHRFNVTFGVVAILSGLGAVGCAKGMWPGDSDCDSCHGHSSGDMSGGHYGGTHSGGDNEAGAAGCDDGGTGGTAGATGGNGGTAGNGGAAGNGGTAGNGGSGGDAGDDGESRADAAPVLLSLLGDPAAALGQSSAWFPGNSGPNTGSIPADADLAILDTVVDLGDILLLTSRTEATSPVDCSARSGALGENLSFEPGADPSEPLVIDLLTAGGTELPAGLANILHLELGAFAAETTFVSGELDNRYRVADVDLVLGSPAVATAAAELYEALRAVDTQIEQLINGVISAGVLQGILGSIPGVPVPTITVDSNIRDEVFADLLTQSLTSANEAVTIDLSTGTVTAHLDELVEGGINNQPPNTELINANTYTLLTTPIQEILSDAASASLGSIDGALDAVTITLNWSGPTIGGTVNVNWTFTLQQALTGNMPAPVNTGTGTGLALGTVLVTALVAADDVIGALFTPVYNTIIADGAFDDLIDDVVDDFGGSVVDVLDPVFDLVAEVVSVQVNHQTWETCTNGDSEEVPYQNRISALSVGLLQDADTARLDLGWASCSVTLPQCD
jgi:hypothetical protein